MEVLIGIAFIGIVIAAVIFTAKKSPKLPPPPGSQTFGNSSLDARVRSIPANDDLPHAHFAVEMRGTLHLPPYRKIMVHHFLTDTTDGDPMPVIALLDFQQASDSVAFYDTTELFTTNPGDYLAISTWQVMNLRVFPEMIKAPHSGKRTLTANVAIVTDRDELLWERSLPFLANLPLAGYIEDRERERADDGLIVRMAVAVAASAGDVSDEELEAIRDWSQARLSYLDDDSDERTERAAELNGSLKRSVADAEAGRLDLGATMSRFTAEGSEGGRIEAVELALAVMRADGIADRDEMELINRLAAEFEIDPDWFAENRDKSISGLVSQTDGPAAYATLLGIDVNADQETLKRDLAQLYDRWSSRAESMEDPDKRQEALEMLDTIARARRELLA